MIKKIAFFLILMFFLQQGYSQRKYVVIVGVADYKNSKMDLRYSDDDAYRFYAYMKSTKGGSVPDNNIAILVDEAATKKNILNTMNKIYARASSSDMLVFYFSGHGGEGVFCPYETNSTYNSLLTHSDVKKVFKKYPTKYKIVFGDACHSGSIYDGTPTNNHSSGNTTNTNVVIMMSSKYNQTSQENPQIRQGAFSYYLLRGLQGKADRNKDKLITLEELFPYIKANVLNFTHNRQTPFIEGKASKTMVIGRLR